VRKVGKVAELEQRVWQDAPEGVVGMARTRWPTHGKLSENDAHPQIDCTGKVYLAHKGIIENYLLLKKQLAAAGHSFRSETDTEVLAHLIESL
jgi:glucosamine--fructose-6-phosphate aminotransferase (isomerizing)